MKRIWIIFAIFFLVARPLQTQAALLGPLVGLVDDLTHRVFDILTLRKLKVISGGIVATTPDESQDYTDIEWRPTRRAKRSTYHSAKELPKMHADCVKVTPKLDKRVTRNKKKT